MTLLWAGVTLLAAFLQNLRNLLQRRIKEHLSIAGATFSRFAFAAPMAALYLAAFGFFHRETLPSLTAPFFGYTAVAAITQILANVALLSAFRYRNFVVATTFSKTEAGQTALFSAAILHEPPGLVAALGIVVSFFGVVVLAAARGALNLRTLLVSWLDTAALHGLLAGFFLGAAAIGYRGSVLALESGSALLRAVLALSVATALQLICLGLYLAIREPGMLKAVARQARSALGIGVISATTSVAWLTAGAMHNVSHVRALGQVELVFAFLTTHFVFHERTARMELLGIAIVSLGLLVVILGA